MNQAAKNRLARANRVRGWRYRFEALLAKHGVPTREGAMAGQYLDALDTLAATGNEAACVGAWSDLLAVLEPTVKR